MALSVSLCLAIVCFFESAKFTNGVPSRPCGNTIEWISDIDDCSVYYICAGGQFQKMNCGKEFSFDVTNRVCVPKGSVYDSCAPSPCLGKTGRIPHSGSCALFYNCDDPSRKDETWEPRLRECPHPHLFNAESSRCEPYKRVDCGDRPEPKSPCSYYANQCRKAHCVPCNVRYASCEGKKNGLHPWTGREWSPFYVGCRQERVLFQKECPRSGESVQLFDPKKKICVTTENNFV